jgi:ribonuclease T1
VAFFTKLRACASAVFAAALLAVAALSVATGASARGPHPVIAVIRVYELPPEARDTLASIRQGGPFRYERDGVVFGNFERQLPWRERGFYHEYTVRTPGVDGRGARRIIAGADGELYYTADHYRTFRRVVE